MKKYNADLFNNIDSSELENILEKIHFQIRKYKKGDIIAYEGDFNNDLRILIKGEARTEMMSEQKTINIAKLKEGSTLAVAFIFGSKNILPVNIIALEDVEVMAIPKSEVIKMLSMNEVFLENILNQLSNQTQFLAKRIQFLNLNTIKDKLILYIKQLSHLKKSEWVKLDKTQKQLSEYFGVGRPSLARSLKELEDEKKIEVNREKEIRVINS